MDDTKLQELVSEACEGKLFVKDLGRETFKELVGGLARMYSARVFNCVDATARYDKEWLMLSSLLLRCKSVIEANENR